jgi:membrane peptidoglycan carboxypeptidase
VAGRLAICGVLVGVALAALTFPIVAAAGAGVRYLAPDTTTLPAILRSPWTAKTTYVYANDGKTLLTSFYTENRRDVPLSAVAPVMRQAMVAAEDVRFYQHGGVDPRSVARAFVANDKAGTTRQGASTLTMQYVRNVLKEDPTLTPQQRVDVSADTMPRKIREMRYAIAIEKMLPKPEILSRYLNIAYFGNGAYGIYAASRAYFNKGPGDLTLPEATLLAGLVQSPDTYNPVSGDRAAALVRRTYVLTAMAKMKVITAQQAARAGREPLRLHPTQEPNDCTAVSPAHNDWGFFCDYFRQWWNAQPAFGATPADRDNALNQGGYRVVTTLDPKIQETALNQSLAVYGYGLARSLPMAIVQPGTGRVLAMAVNRHYSLGANPRDRNYPNTVDQLVAGGVGIDGYQSGSTFKMFTMLAALESGRPLSTAFTAPSPLVSQWPASGAGSCRGRWCPVNDNPPWMNGHRTMWDGYGRSVNTYFVWLEEQVGPQRVIAMARRLGIVLRSGGDTAMADRRGADWGSFTLGVAQTTPLDLANAYATVAADGVYCKPLPVLSVTGPNGDRFHAADPACHRAISADVARAATDAARCPVSQQSAFGRCNGGTAPNVGAIFAGRPVAGKTGSSENNATETFVGFTPQIAGAAIAANPDNPSDAVGGGVSGQVDIAVARTLAMALRGKPVVGFPAPSRAIAFGKPSGRR